MDVGTLLRYGKKKKPASQYPSFNRRMMALTIDSVVLLIFLPVINALAPVHAELLGHYSIDQQDPKAASRLALHVLQNKAFLQSWISNFFMQIVFWCLYSAICLHFWSATLGKMILRMKVVDNKSGGRITDMQVLLRSFGYMVSAGCLGLGFIWMSFNKRGRGWHDFLADTVIVNAPLFLGKKKPVAEAVPETAPIAITPEITEQENV